MLRIVVSGCEPPTLARATAEAADMLYLSIVAARRAG